MIGGIPGTGKRLIVLVAVPILGLAAVVAVSGGYLTGADGNGAGLVLPSPADYSLAPGDIYKPRLEQFSAYLSRPLFSPSRRAGKPGLAAGLAAEELQDTGEYSFQGAIISDSARIAVIRRNRTAEFVRLGVGQQLDDWLVEAIYPDRAVLRKGDNRMILRPQGVPVRLRDKRRPGGRNKG